MASIAPRGGPLGTANARHLLRRATYSTNAAMVQAYAAKTATQALADLFAFDNTQFPPPRYLGQLYIPTTANPAPVFDPLVHNNRAYLRNWWLQCALTDRTLQHKLAFFLHGIFVADDAANALYTMYDYVELLRWHTNGSLKELALRITTNLRMLYYLDNRLNSLQSPNENFAREFLELFTIQKGPQIAAGNYTTFTEQDVQQAARVLTGFDGNQGTASSRLNNLDPMTGIPRGTATISKHDKLDKTFSSAFNGRTITGRSTASGMVAELQEMVDMIFDQPATARSYARRIYRYFAGRNITAEIENDIIAPMAATLQQTNYHLPAAVTQLLCSLHFYDEDDNEKGDQRMGARVKDPLDFALGLFSTLQVALPNYNTQSTANFQFFNNRITNRLSRLDLPFWRPVAVSGYPPQTEAPQYDKLWITPVSLGGRYNDFIDSLLVGYRHSGVLIRFNSVVFVQLSGLFSNPAQAETLVHECYDLLLSRRPTGGRHAYFMEALLGGLSTINWQFDWMNYIQTGDATTVRVALDRLFSTLIKSPEYQVY